jgi:cysteine-rich repeat protein
MTKESGWNFSISEPTICTGIPGDGLIRGTEICDDQNLESGDGCSDEMKVEAGY